MKAQDTAARAAGGRFRLSVVAGISIAVTAALYAIGRIHSPNYTTSLFGRSGLNAIVLKSQLATAVLVLAALQLLLAAWIYRKLPLAGAAPRTVPVAHRVIGVVAFAVTVPVAVHCLLAYGVQLGTLRVAVHSLAGCFFYGAFVAKVLIVQSRRLPGWALPVAGGILVVLVVVLWYTSALWYYDGFRLPGM